MEIEKSDIDIINKIGETLDMTLYETLSNKGKNFLRNNIRFSTNKIFSELFQNYLKRDLIKYPENIIGPGYLAKMTRHDKIIYLFGEYHLPYKEEKCDRESGSLDKSKRMFQFFNYLFDTTPVPIDFYLETAPTKIVITDKSDIDSIRYLVEDCVNPNKEKCQYKCVRIHYVDIRFIDDFPDLDIDETNTNIKNILLQVKEFLKFDTDYLRILKKEREKTDCEEIKLYIDSVIKNHKYIYNTYKYEDFKELYESLYDNVKLDVPKEEVKTTFECIREIYRLFSIFIIQGKNIDRYVIINMIRFQELVKYLQSDGNWKLVDAYTLARMFRSFKKDKNRISIAPRNIIFYGGLEHARNMTNILESMGFEKYIFESVLIGEEYPFCIDISGINNKMFNV